MPFLTDIHEMTPVAKSKKDSDKFPKIDFAHQVSPKTKMSKNVSTFKNILVEEELS